MDTVHFRIAASFKSINQSSEKFGILKRSGLLSSSSATSQLRLLCASGKGFLLEAHARKQTKESIKTGISESIKIYPPSPAQKCSSSHWKTSSSNKKTRRGDKKSQNFKRVYEWEGKHKNCFVCFEYLLILITSTLWNMSTTNDNGGGSIEIEVHHAILCGC